MPFPKIVNQMGSFGEKRKKLFFRFCRSILDIFGFPLLSFDIVKIILDNPNPSSKNFAELRYWLKLEYLDFVYLHFPWEFLTLFAYIFIVIESKKRIFCWQF